MYSDRNISCAKITFVCLYFLQLINFFYQTFVMRTKVHLLCPNRNQLYFLLVKFNVHASCNGKLLKVSMFCLFPSFCYYEKFYMEAGLFSKLHSVNSTFGINVNQFIKYEIFEILKKYFY